MGQGFRVHRCDLLPRARLHRLHLRPSQRLALRQLGTQIGERLLQRCRLLLCTRAELLRGRQLGARIRERSVRLLYLPIEEANSKDVNDFNRKAKAIITHQRAQRAPPIPAFGFSSHTKCV